MMPAESQDEQAAGQDQVFHLVEPAVPVEAEVLREGHDRSGLILEVRRLLHSGTGTDDEIIYNIFLLLDKNRDSLNADFLKEVLAEFLAFFDIKNESQLQRALLASANRGSQATLDQQVKDFKQNMDLVIRKKNIFTRSGSDMEDLEKQLDQLVKQVSLLALETRRDEELRNGYRQAVRFVGRFLGHMERHEAAEIAEIVSWAWESLEDSEKELLASDLWLHAKATYKQKNR